TRPRAWRDRSAVRLWRATTFPTPRQKKADPARSGVRIEGESSGNGAAMSERLAAERTTTALTRARRTFLRFVDAQWPAVHLVAVQALDRGLRLARAHLNE